jgi:arginine deiminase
MKESNRFNFVEDMMNLDKVINTCDSADVVILVTTQLPTPHLDKYIIRQYGKTFPHCSLTIGICYHAGMDGRRCQLCMPKPHQ